MTESVSTIFGFAAPWFIAGGRRWPSTGRAPRNARLQVAAMAYARRGLQVLRTTPGSFELKQIPMTYWARETPGFVRRTRTFVEFRPILTELLQDLPEHVELLRQVKGDQSVARHIDQLVGSRMHAARRLTLEELTHGWITRNVSTSGILEFDEDAFAGDYEAAEDALYSDQVRHVLLGPIPGLRLTGEPLLLPDGLEIDRFSDDEVSACLSSGYAVPHPGSDFMFGTYLGGVRLTYELPKSIESGRDGDAPPGHSETQPPPAEIVLDVVRALRVLKAGRIAAPGAVRYGSGWLTFGGLAAHPLVPPMEPLPPTSPGMTVTSADGGALKRLWATLNGDRLRTRPALAVGFRRFGDSMDRRHPDDRLIDLMIAAEALLTRSSDEDNAPGRGKAAPMGRRAVELFRSFGEPADEVDADIREAYRTRNGIVHASTAPEQPRVDVGRMAEVAERHLRRLLQLLIAGQPDAQAGLPGDVQNTAGMPHRGPSIIQASAEHPCRFCLDTTPSLHVHVWYRDRVTGESRGDYDGIQYDLERGRAKFEEFFANLALRSPELEPLDKR